MNQMNFLCSKSNTGFRKVKKDRQATKFLKSSFGEQIFLANVSDYLTCKYRSVVAVYLNLNVWTS